MGGEQQLQAELKKLESAMKTREACEELAKFVRLNEVHDPLVHRQPDNPYLSSAGPKGPDCCVVS